MIIGFESTFNEVKVLNELAQLVAEGKLQVPIDTIFPFTTEGVIQAYEKVALKKSLGKNVIQMVTD